MLKNTGSGIYAIKNKNTQQISIRNLRGFAKENLLNVSHLYSVAAGNRRHHKGYTCKLGDNNGIA